MAKGLPKWAIKEAKRRGAKNVFAYAWTLVKRRKGKKRTRRRTRRSSNPRRRVRRIARRRRKRRRSAGMTIPLAPVAGLFAGLAGPIDYALRGDFNSAMIKVCKNYTGYNPEVGVWSPEDLKSGVLPLVIGLLVHKFVGGPPLNLNKVLARAKVPFIRI